MQTSISLYVSLWVHRQVMARKLDERPQGGGSGQIRKGFTSHVRKPGMWTVLNVGWGHWGC